MRGDPPIEWTEGDDGEKSTPHARGSTQVLPGTQRVSKVYPACAGIHRSKAIRPIAPICLPRMRGDPPDKTSIRVFTGKSTPHARGSTLAKSVPGWKWNVYPACAGIHLAKRLGYVVIEGLPRMRGDPPYQPPAGSCAWSSTPHARGSTFFLPP